MPVNKSAEQVTRAWFAAAKLVSVHGPLVAVQYTDHTARTSSTHLHLWLL